jgi:tetratricopeptide (TPR) repeat protein
MVLNDPIHAISCFKAAYQIDSSVYDITLNVALLSNQIGDTATSIIYYGKCISNNPEMLQSYSNLSYLYFRMNRFEESIAVNQKAIVYNPNWPEPYDNIARVYSGLNQPEKAEPYLKKLQELR